MIKFINSFITDLIEIRCLHNDEKNLPGKFVVLDKMAAVAQAGHMTNEYSRNKAIHVFYVRPGKNNLHALRALAVCSCSVLSTLAAAKKTDSQVPPCKELRHNIGLLNTNVC